MEFSKLRDSLVSKTKRHRGGRDYVATPPAQNCARAGGYGAVLQSTIRKLINNRHQESMEIALHFEDSKATQKRNSRKL